MPMPNAFEQIIQFLGHFDAEVQGREAIRPDPELRRRLDRFAKGECSEAERSELCQLAMRQPELVSYLAESVKQLRDGAAAS